MSTAFDAASVILPQGSGYKAGKLYGWRPDVKELQDIDLVQNTANGSRVNEQGLIEFMPANTPRWDWSEGGSCPSLLVEPQRTNLLTYSEEFDNADWGKTDVTITTNSTTAPDGNNTADLMSGDGTSTSARVQSSNFTLNSSGEYWAECFVKAGTNDWIRLDVFGLDDRPVVYFNVGNGTIGTQTATTLDAEIIEMNDGWYNCRLKGETTTELSGQLFIWMTEEDNNVNFSSTAAQEAANLYLWGAQVEKGSFATSYIKTEASTATRNKDVISKDGIASLIGQGAFSKYFEVLFFEAGTIEFSDGTTDNLVQIGTSSGFDDFRFRVVRDTVEQANILGGTPAKNTFYKLFGAAATNNASLIVDGTVIGSDTSVTTFSAATITEIDFSNFKGKIKVGAWYLNRLTNPEGQSLTS